MYVVVASYPATDPWTGRAYTHPLAGQIVHSVRVADDEGNETILFESENPDEAKAFIESAS